MTRPPVTRITYLDGLRGWLSVLVVLHHVAITYGAQGSWYYSEPNTSAAQTLLLTTFVACNQFYFMGLFFLLAGIFTPASLERKGTTAFLRERWVRLGIPLLLFALLVSPPLEYVAQVYRGRYQGSFFDFLAQQPPLLKDFVPGPLWFVETLLVFSLLYLLWRYRFSGPSSRLERLNIRHLWGFAITLAFGSFLVRLFYPIGKEFLHLQLAYFPQYVLLFAAGIRAGSTRIFDTLPRTWLLPCAVLTVLGAAMVPLLVLSNGGIDARFLGGFFWQAIAICLVEALVCPCACITTVLLFRDVIPADIALWKLLGANSYGIYIVHAPICITLSLLLRDTALPPPARLAIVAGLAVSLSLLASVVIRRWGGRPVRAVLG